jgi:hypothetical protein
MKPERIQLRRKKGWRLPANTVVVARPSKWGNPTTVINGTRRNAVELYRDQVDLWSADRKAMARRELRGKNLACWCPVFDEHGNRVPCHADVLIELANEKLTDGGQKTHE